MRRRVILFLLNNRVTNWILILLGKDDFIKKFTNNWKMVKYNSSKSLQENVGFSHTPDVETAISKIHDYVNWCKAEYLRKGDVVLDIGCGVGLYLKDFIHQKLYGLDLSKDLLEKCKEVAPAANLINENYLKVNFEKNSFHFIYSISVLEYVPPSKIKVFFKKISSELVPGGIMLIQYPHALNNSDKWFADLSYVSYTPNFIEKSLPKSFEIIKHQHSYDNRVVKGVDERRYGVEGVKNFRNGMLLIARKSNGNNF